MFRQGLYLMMETANPTFSFVMQYAGEPVNCKVIMQSNAIEILFDGRSMGTIEQTEEWTWIQASGVILPEEIIDEIGTRVESEYE